MHDEERDTRHPKMVTEFFMGFLRSIGKPVEVSILCKNTREEVMWLGALKPWRRSPMWWLVRVTMQLIFSRSAGGFKPQRDLYKKFMVFLMSRVLRLSHEYSLSADLTYAMNAKLVRRLLKLELSVDDPILKHVQGVMLKTSKLLHTKWSTIIEQSLQHHDLPCLKQLNFSEDIPHSIPALDEYLKLIPDGQTTKARLAFSQHLVLSTIQRKNFLAAKSLLQLELTCSTT